MIYRKTYLIHHLKQNCTRF